MATFANRESASSNLAWPVWRAIAFGVAVGGAAASAPAGGTLERFAFSEVHMGVPVKIALYTADERAANLAAKAVYARFAELNQMLSDYDPESELSKLSQTSPHAKPIPVSEPLWEVLVRSQQLSKQTGGAFDVTVGPLVRLWRRARRNGQLPSADRVEKAKLAVGYEKLQLDEDQHAVRLTHAEMRLDLGGIAMGYAVDEGLKILAKRGIKSAMIDASGDIGVSDAPPESAGWRIGIVPLKADADPSTYLILANAAVTTSGDAFQFVEVDGVRYSHIVDPKTGYGLTRHCAVTIVAPDCITADSLATAVSVLERKEGIAFVEQQENAAALILCGTEDDPEVIETSRWKKLNFGVKTEIPVRESPKS
jgi:thiamine biosynthesis lipoprotein